MIYSKEADKGYFSTKELAKNQLEEGGGETRNVCYLSLITL